MKWYQKEVTWGILIKFLICFNLVILAFCWKISNIRITQDQETLDYISELENIIQKEQNYRNTLWNYIDYLKEN